MRLTFPATLFSLLLILVIKASYLPSSGVSDSDFFFHLRYGQWIIDHGHLPAADYFSWTFFGHPYQITQWLGEVAIGASFRAAGYAGTHMLGLSLTAVTIGFAWATATRYVHPSVAMALAIMCNLIQLMVTTRPQLFTFALTAVTLWCLSSWQATGRRAYLWAVVPIVALWVNLHGGFVVGLLLLGLVLAGNAWEALATTKQWKPLVEPAAALTAATLATALNPYGFQALAAVVSISHLQSSNVIIEWQKVVFTTGPGWCYLLMSAPFLALIALGGRLSRQWTPLAAFALVFGYLANRQVPIAGILLTPMIAMVVSTTQHYAGMQPNFRNPSRPFLFGSIIAGLVAALLAWHHARPDLYQRNIDSVHPTYAVRFLQEHRLTDRIFVDTLEAGYLISQGLQVSIDGRMDLYEDSYFFTYYLALRGAPGWDAYLEKVAPRTLLMRDDTALRQLVIASKKWRMIYEDGRYSIFVPLTGVAPDLPTVQTWPIHYLDDRGNLVRRYQP